MTIAREEIGPVLCVLAYEDEDDAVRPGVDSSSFDLHDAAPATRAGRPP